MIIIITLVVLGLDLGSKLLVSRFMELNESIKLINKFLNITYVKNTGVAFSMFDNNSYLVLIVSGIIILGIILYIYKNNFKNIIEKIAYSLILGGALGNFMNRILYGCVIDFIDINIFGYDYPIFNLADTFIVIGVIMLVIYTWRCSNGDKSNR